MATISRLLITALLASWSSFAIAFCVNLPADNPDPAVRVCENWSEYTFYIEDQKYSHPKAQFRKDLSDKILTLLKSTSFPEEYLEGAEVEFWVSVPEVNPAATSARVIVKNDLIDFILFGSIHPSEWDFTVDDLAVFVEGEYPDSFGSRAATLLIKSKADTKEDDLNEFLFSFENVENIEPMGSDWYKIGIPAFSEVSTSEQIENHGAVNKYLEAVRYNQMYEWIALRERGFAFSLGNE